MGERENGDSKTEATHQKLVRQWHGVKIEAEGQTKLLVPDWPVRCAGERTIGNDIYFSGKQNLEMLPFFSHCLKSGADR